MPEHALDHLLSSCRALLAARAAETDALNQRERAVRLWADEHQEVPRRQVGERLRAELAASGMTEDEIASVGLSDGMVRVMLERPRQG